MPRVAKPRRKPTTRQIHKAVIEAIWEAVAKWPKDSDHGDLREHALRVARFAEHMMAEHAAAKGEK